MQFTQINVSTISDIVSLAPADVDLRWISNTLKRCDFVGPIQENMKRNFVLEHLKAKGITHTQNGTSIIELDYESLKYELVLASFREIDAENSEGKWF